MSAFTYPRSGVSASACALANTESTSGVPYSLTATSGTWVGFQNAFGNLSGIFGPIVTGIIVDRTGYANAFYLTAAIAAFGAVWWAVGVPRIEQVKLD